MKEETKIIAKPEKVKEKTLSLTEPEVNEIIAYLAKRPYEEVYKYINMLQIKWMQQNK